MSLIVLLILLPLVAGAMIAASPAKLAKSIGLFGTLACVGVFLVLSGDFNWSAGQTDQLSVSAQWFAPLGLEFSLAADTVSPPRLVDRLHGEPSGTSTSTATSARTGTRSVRPRAPHMVAFPPAQQQQQHQHQHQPLPTQDPLRNQSEEDDDEDDR